jgi:glutamate-ammonia-ligase adenylyltransferase
MTQLQPNFNSIPERLREQVQQHWKVWSETEGSEEVTDQALLDEAVRVWAMSDFVARHVLRDTGLLKGLVESGDLFNRYDKGHIHRSLAAWLDGVADEAQLGERLRLFRRREMVRIAWRDLAGRAELDEVTADLSALADACIDQALDYLYRWHCEQWGTPFNAEDRQQTLVVLGMGKLGARELNFSSDVDLIFAYPEEGETRGGRRSTSNQEFFIRLGQRLINVLDTNNAWGFVFRVDMRLRPFGNSGALAISFDAMEEYCQVHGREWERYALIKARVVAGDHDAGEELIGRLRPFIYRKYVDFGAFESLREMKAMISREVQRKGMDDNVKLGAGGIREVEFIGQAFQLIRGGREPTLRIRPILSVLEALRGFGMLPDYVVEELREAYIFLRNTEHRLQEFAEQQTHMLPGDETGQARLAFSMGYEDWSHFEPQLRKRMRRVHEHFEQVFAAPQTEHAEDDELDLTGLWQGSLDEEQACSALERAGYQEPAEVLRQLQQLRAGRQFVNMSSQAHSRINHLMPLLLGAAGGAGHPDLALQRVLILVEGISRRSSYIALLVENPVALSQLVRLCSVSPWIAAQLTRYPQLLDELLDPRTLYAPPQREDIQNELRQRLLSCDEEDLEQQMEVLRHFKQTNVLRVAAADIVGAVPLMRVSDHLTEIAEVVLDATLDLAWRYMVKRHGRPLCGDERVCDVGFAIIAYGKMGGIELGYGSDLDIVFLHSAESAGHTTDGEKPLENSVFYARLAQRMIHILTARTQSGELYEIDTRLRPSGASGMMVSNLDAFEEYQSKQAWTWEHQALVRARVVAGDPGIARAFDAIRKAVIGQKRERGKLRQEVCEMREKMRTQLSKDEAGLFDLKQGRGGIADIEFMVQYAVLAWACDYPALLDYTDNIRLLEGIAKSGLMAPDDVNLLSDAYRAFRARAHRLTLQELPAVTEETEFSDYRTGVERIWRSWMES